MTLDEIKDLARRNGCYVVTKSDTKGPVYILYRKGGERGYRIGKRSSVEGLAALAKKACVIS